MGKTMNSEWDLPAYFITEMGKTRLNFDDLFLFARGNVSAMVIMESLDEFKSTSGLVPSTLPVKYLGVPLISSKLLNKDCKVLVEQAKNQIGDWKNKSLSFAGRLQLCKVFFGVMGSRVMRKQKLHGLSFASPHLRGRSFWAIPLNGADMGWGWRKLLQLWVLVRPYIWTKLGNGNRASSWHDTWDPQGPLIRLISPRDISREGFSLTSKVSDLLLNFGVVWPQEWLRKEHNIGLIQTPNLLSELVDSHYWRDVNGNMKLFSVKCAWEAFRPRGDEVKWYHTVWFNHCIPRYAFHLWLVMRNSLRTQDKLQQWDLGPNSLLCPLCDVQPDSHTHLFFECSFSSQVWMLVRHLADMDTVSPVFHDILLYIQQIAKKRTAKSVFGKLIMAATSYYIWIERNNRLFKNVKRSPDELRDLIMVTVRLKIMTFRFKNTTSATRLLERWKMPRNFRLYGN
ncbi:homeodomain-like protein [Tanacetum coccineum]